MVVRYVDRRRDNRLERRDWIVIAFVFAAGVLVKESALIVPGLLVAADLLLVPGPIRVSRLRPVWLGAERRLPDGSRRSGGLTHGSVARSEVETRGRGCRADAGNPGCRTKRGASPDLARSTNARRRPRAFVSALASGKRRRNWRPRFLASGVMMMPGDSRTASSLWTTRRR